MGFVALAIAPIVALAWVEWYVSAAVYAAFALLYAIELKGRERL